MSGATLITGASGYLGRRLSARLARDGERLILWARSPEPVAGAATARGELTDDDPFREIDPRQVRRIIHAAAVTRFNVEPETATRVNVDGTRKILDFARTCPGLESIDLTSTIYAFGLEQGRLDEIRATGAAGFANEYERSKFEAEQLLLDQYPDLPWRIARIATVIADDDHGGVTQQNAVHNTLKLLYYGLLSLVPGKPEVPLYFVTAEFVTAALTAIVREGPLSTIYHVCHTRPESITLDGLLDTVFETFESDPVFRGRRALRPLYTDADSFDLMVDQVSGFSRGILGQAVGSVAPFARELFSVKDVTNRNLMRLSGVPPAPDPKQLIAGVCHDLISSRFGVAHAAV